LCHEISRVADQDPHYFGKLNPDLDPQSEKLNPDPNSKALEAQNKAVECRGRLPASRLKMAPWWVCSVYQWPQIRVFLFKKNRIRIKLKNRIRFRIKVKSWIRIRINVMRIRNRIFFKSQN
jgi:hypothetical protein